MKVENVKIEKLAPYIRNNKEHSKKQVNMIANSIKEFWFLQPLVIDSNNVVIVGHWRLLAAQELKMGEVPCIRVENLTEEQINKYRILDNKLNESDWHELNLREELGTLDNMDFGDLKINKEDMFPELFEELGEKIKEEKPEVEFTEELGEESNYLVLYFDNSIDWINAQSIFDLKPVKALDSKKGYERVGVGRVIDGTKFIEKILAADNKGVWK